MRILTDRPRYSFVQVAFTLRDGKFICTDAVGIHPCSQVTGKMSPSLRAYYVAGSREYWCTHITAD